MGLYPFNWRSSESKESTYVNRFSPVRFELKVKSHNKWRRSFRFIVGTKMVITTSRFLFCLKVHKGGVFVEYNRFWLLNRISKITTENNNKSKNIEILYVWIFFLLNRFNSVSNVKLIKFPKPQNVFSRHLVTKAYH